MPYWHVWKEVREQITHTVYRSADCDWSEGKLWHWWLDGSCWLFGASGLVIVWTGTCPHTLCWPHFLIWVFSRLHMYPKLSAVWALRCTSGLYTKQLVNAVALGRQKKTENKFAWQSRMLLIPDKLAIWRLISHHSLNALFIPWPHFQAHSHFCLHHPDLKYPPPFSCLASTHSTVKTPFSFLASPVHTFLTPRPPQHLWTVSALHGKTFHFFFLCALFKFHVSAYFLCYCPLFRLGDIISLYDKVNNFLHSPRF